MVVRVALQLDSVGALIALEPEGSRPDDLAAGADLAVLAQVLRLADREVVAGKVHQVGSCRPAKPHNRRIFIGQVDTVDGCLCARPRARLALGRLL